MDEEDIFWPLFDGLDDGDGVALDLVDGDDLVRRVAGDHGARRRVGDGRGKCQRGTIEVARGTSRAVCVARWD